MTDRVATSDIPYGDPGRGVYAFRVGDRVPEALVKANDWGDYVSSPESKAGRQATATAAGSEVAK